MRWVHPSLEVCRVVEVLTPRLRIHSTLDEEALVLLELLRDERVSSCFLDPPDPDESEAAAELVQREFTWVQKGWLQVTAVSKIEASPASHVVGGARIFGAEISYYIDPRIWRQGFGYELVHAVCEIAYEQLKLEKLNARVLRHNIASTKILERLGFRFCGLDYQFHARRPGKFPVLHFELLMRQAVA